MHEIEVSREKTNLGHRNAATLVRKAAEAALLAEGITMPCLVSVMLTDEEGIRLVNREFRGVDRATDVLSFPLNELTPGAFDPELCEADPDAGVLMLGDMMISIPACEKQGEEFGHGFDREIQYLTVHSILHLLGYDHLDEGEQKRRMRAREKAILGEPECGDDYRMRPSECRQVDPDKRARRRKDRHCFQQAADHPKPYYRHCEPRRYAAGSD